MGECTIVMYHYVRDTAGSRFPGIHARFVDEFKLQLAYLQRKHSIVGYDQLKDAIVGSGSLPKSAAILTFDDGLADHYETVYPILDRRDLTGFFFPPVDAVRGDSLLDVHKIHLILAASDDTEALLEQVYSLIEQFDIDSPETYYERLAEAGRWDPPEIIFVKRLLQRELPHDVRTTITAELFDTIVGEDERALARDWYMTIDQLRTMVESGMYVGSHGTSHRWLDTLDSKQLRSEFDRSLSMLDAIGAPTSNWLVSYPYGSYDDATLRILSEYDCLGGVTTESQTADLPSDDPYTLPRLDTNDVPPVGNG